MSERVPLPRYTPTVVYACPECWGDLADEGATFYCSACDETYTWPEVIPCDESEFDRD